MEREAGQQKQSLGVGCSRARLLTRAEPTFSQATRGRNTRASGLPNRHFTRLGCLCSWLHGQHRHTQQQWETHTLVGEAALFLRVRNRLWLKKDMIQNMGLILPFGL